MPGITGIIGTMEPRERELRLLGMLQSMSVEPFYRSGHWCHHEMGLALGWTGHGDSVASSLPVWNEREDRCVVFFGEDFAHRGEDGKGGAAEFLLAGYEREGQAFLPRLNGLFCGVVVDLREKLILLFNDRYGVSRVFYHETPDAFFFSSEVTVLLNLLPETRSLDSRGLGEYLSCGCVLQDRTLFQGISSLPCGACWKFSPGQIVQKRQYFRGEDWERQERLGASEFYEELRKVWKRVLPPYWQAGERVGLSLTGGVDSRMILAWTRPEAGEMPCYTFCGNYRESNDVRLARRLAEIYRQPHSTLRIDDGYFSGFADLAERTIRLSGGSMDVTGTLDLYLQRRAREIAPVRISGVYGGEILRKLVVFKPMPVSRTVWGQEISDSMALAAATYGEELKAHPVSFSAFKQAPWHMTGKFSIERSQVTFRSPFFDNEVVGLAYRAPAEVMASNELSLRLIEEGNGALRDVATDRGLNGGRTGLRTELRHGIQQFLFKAEYAFDYGMPQWLAGVDRALAPFHLERLFLGRHGPSHFRVWYRDRLQDYVKSILLDPRSLGRPYLEKRTAEAVVHRHLSGQGNYTLEIHKLLSLELIQRVLLQAG